MGRKKKPSIGEHAKHANPSKLPRHEKGQRRKTMAEKEKKRQKPDWYQR
jgi:hypothetical protein